MGLHHCGVKVRKRRDGSKYCRHCGTLPSLADRRVAFALSVPLFAGIAARADALGITISAPPAPVPSEDFVPHTWKPRVRAGLSGKDSTDVQG